MRESKESYLKNNIYITQKLAQNFLEFLKWIVTPIVSVIV